MSLKTFLNKIWSSIEKIFGSLGKETRKVVKLAHDLVENIKTFVDSPAADILTALIPGTWDDGAKNFLRGFLPKLLIILTAVDVTQYENEDEALKAAVKKIQAMPKDAQKILTHGIASVVTEKLTTEDVDWSDSIALQQYYHKHEAA